MSYGRQLTRPEGMPTLLGLAVRMYRSITDGYELVTDGTETGWSWYWQQLSGEWLGQELIVNGGFDTTSDWTLSGASIADGVVTIAGGANGSIAQIVDVTNGDDIRITYTVTSTSTSGLLFLSSTGLGGATLGIPKTVGTHEVAITVANATAPVKLLHNLADAISIDNISVKEVINVA